MTTSDNALIPPAEQAAIDARLNERARRLAEVPPSADASRAIEVLVCRLGVEEFALELRLLHGVYPATGLTRVPCTPPFVAGLLNLRGEILTVLDLAVALGLTGYDQREVLLAETPQVRVGLLVDEVLGVRRIALDSLERGLAGSDATRGVADARTVLLDLEALLSDARFEPANPSARREKFAT
jgi:purine-binding chemotaxis protein CheW